MSAKVINLDTAREQKILTELIQEMKSRKSYEDLTYVQEVFMIQQAVNAGITPVECSALDDLKNKDPGTFLKNIKKMTIPDSTLEDWLPVLEAALQVSKGTGNQSITYGECPECGLLFRFSRPSLREGRIICPKCTALPDLKTISFRDGSLGKDTFLQEKVFATLRAASRVQDKEPVSAVMGWEERPIPVAEAA